MDPPSPMATPSREAGEALVAALLATPTASTADVLRDAAAAAALDGSEGIDMNLLDDMIAQNDILSLLAADDNASPLAAVAAAEAAAASSMQQSQGAGAVVGSKFQQTQQEAKCISPSLSSLCISPSLFFILLEQARAKQARAKPVEQARAEHLARAKRVEQARAEQARAEQARAEQATTRRAIWLPWCLSD